MEQPEDVGKYQDNDAQINQYGSKIEARDMEAKERGKKNTRPIKANTGKGVERLEIKFGGKKYDTQFVTINREKKNI